VTAEESIGDELELGHPLPRGRHQLSAEEVADNQRRRLIEALARSVAERGYAATSVERILEGSGVSRGTFYELFPNRRACLLAAHEVALEELSEKIGGACAGQQCWAEKAKAAIHAVIDFASERPDQARLLALDALAADREASSRGLAAMDWFVDLLHAGREHHPRAIGLPEATERALVGSVSMTISSRLISGEPVTGLASQLVYLVLVPYVGREEAERLAAVPA
jgi:AcrR family transcriptional regulator